MWEKHTDALLRLLSRDKRLIRVDELRRAIESIAPAQYEQMKYYERWITAIEMLLIEKGVLTHDEIEQKIATLDARTP
jgi:nitrile hydratase